MAVLHVKFPDEWRGWNIRECHLSSVSPNAFGSSPPCNGNLSKEVITVKVNPEVDTDPYSDSPVLQGTLQQPRSFSDSSDVALKFAMREDLIGDLVREAKMYTGPLAPLQGSTCPRYYGLYVGSVDDGLSIGCLLLEYWGQVLQMPFPFLSLELRCVPTSSHPM